MNLSRAKTVITQNQLIDFAGSEIVTLELATHLSALGAEVLVLTNSLGEPMMGEFKKLKNVTVYVNPSDEFERRVIRERPNLVWVHHQLLPEVLLRPDILSGAGYVFHHMSPYHPTEFPVFSRLESEIADIILFNSQETKDELLAQGVFNKTASSKLAVLGNPAPDDFAVDRTYSDSLQSLLIVTNHLADELKDIKERLDKEQVKVTILGLNGDLKERLTPEILVDYDAVVTIGKTVQYALLSRTPVYCYDHFGGPGYLSRDNIELSRERNFSGRNGGRRSAEEIVDELVGGYAKAVDFMCSIEERYLDNFRLSVQIERLASKVLGPKKTSGKKIIGRDQIAGLQKVNELNRTIQEILRVYNRESAQYKLTIAELTTSKESLEADLKDKQLYISKLQDSLVYRLYARLKRLVRFFK